MFMTEVVIMPYLPSNREIKYVPDTNKYMQSAHKAAEELSLDSEHPTGAVVVKHDKVIGRGANGSEYHLINDCTRKMQGSPTGEEYNLCEGCNPIHHAEQSAIRNALENAEDPHDADLYLWGHWWCCKPCWDCMIQHKIRIVYLVDGAAVKFRREK